MGQIKAFLVGVCEYNGSPSLPICYNDVVAVKQALVLGLGAHEEDVFLCGQSGNIGINEFLTKLSIALAKTTSEDTFILYFSGHGGKNSLLLSDKPLNLQCLIDLIEKTKPKNKIIVLDSCHSGGFSASNTKTLDLNGAIEKFVGYGYAVLASCNANQCSGFNRERGLSIYTAFLVDALTSRFLIRKGKKSLEAINEAIFHFAKLWNSKNPAQAQQPIFRSNIGGTIYFDVEEYNPYHVANVYEETERYIIYQVDPIYSSIKRLSVKVILRFESSLEEIAEIANEIKDKLLYANVYPSAQAELRFKGEPARIIVYCFGYSEEDIIDCNYICNSIWVDDTQDKDQWYRGQKPSEVINGVYCKINNLYEIIKKSQHDLSMDDDVLIGKIRAITAKLINNAERFIQIYREFCNKELSEDDLINSVEPINREILTLYIEQSNLPYPSLTLRTWASANENLAGAIYNLSLYYDRKNLDTWTHENRTHLVSMTIKEYESALEVLHECENLL